MSNKFVDAWDSYCSLFGRDNKKATELSKRVEQIQFDCFQRELERKAEREDIAIDKAIEQNSVEFLRLQFEKKVYQNEVRENTERAIGKACVCFSFLILLAIGNPFYIKYRNSCYPQETSPDAEYNDSAMCKKIRVFEKAFYDMKEFN